MNTDIWWLLAALVYIVPFGVCQISYDDSLREQEKLAPARPVVEDRRFVVIELLWAAGLAALLSAGRFSR